MISDNISLNDLSTIENIINNNEILLLKFDYEDSKYNNFINNIGFKLVNITDSEIINFYEIETLPSILVYKRKNLIDSIKGFHTKTSLIKKILTIIE